MKHDQRARHRRLNRGSPAATALQSPSPAATGAPALLLSRLADATPRIPFEGSSTSRPPIWPDLPALTPELFINRELSWLDFNQRVLEEAMEPGNPLLERIKFIAIFSANLDEWFMIRVAGVRRKITAGIRDVQPDGRTPAAQLAAIQQQTQRLLDQQAAVLVEEILPALAARGIVVTPYEGLDPPAQAALGEVFERDIFPVLTPQAIDRGRRFPHVSNRSLNLIVALRLASGARFARVKIPGVLPRLIQLPLQPGASDRLRFTWLEQVIAVNLGRLFAGAEVLAAYPFHVTRDSDISLDEEEEDADGDELLAIIREHLSQRTFGSLVRLMVDTAMPPDVRTWLAEQIHAMPRDIYVVDGPLALEDVAELTKLDRPDLKDPPFAPAPWNPAAARGEAATGAAVVAAGAAASDLFAILRQHDVLLHHPYQSFSAVTDFVQAAAADPDVVAIKQTLYRVGRDSPLIPTLIAARDDDTQVAALVELKARFDEENNITWAEQLEEHGVHVAYGLPGLKTHCKATLVVRREADGLRRYAHLATGNYNATTARIYEDLGLLTAREDLTRDVAELFNMLTGYAEKDSYRQLWIAPLHLRERFLAAIRQEIEAHERTGEGHLIFKLNSLVDRETIRALHAASRAGVKIDLIVRGACCLRPGVPGWSETIRVISIVGRFLEHSRIYYFRNGGQDEVYLGSADLMERNLDRRVEAVFPVEDPVLAALVRDVILPAYLRDTVNARELQPDGTYLRLQPAPGVAPFDVQHWLLQHYGAQMAPPAGGL